MIYLIGWKNVYQRIDCRSVCQLTPDCEFWTWAKSDNHCYTKHDFGWEMYRDTNADSGDKSGNIDWAGYNLKGGDMACRKIIE